MNIKRFNQFIIEKNIPTNINLPKDIIEISNAFINAGKDIFLVGGAVRDFIQGKIPKDYDLVTNALPDETKKILKNFRVSDEQGKNFGVLRVYTKDEPLGYEIATYRKDISKGRDTKGEGEKVKIGEDITMEDDSNRRDLTINSLFYDIKNKQIIDLVGGVSDVKNNIIRAVGDPKQRFDEDRLRICRVFRFASRTGGKIDKETALAINSDNRLRNISNIDDVSPERIWEEFCKAFEQSKDFTVYLNYLKEFDMWEEYFPNSVVNEDFINSNNLIVILSNLFLYENTETLLRKMVQNWKIETEISRKVVFLINFFNFQEDFVFDFYKKKIESNTEDETILEWIEKKNLNLPKYSAFLKFKPSVSAQELMKLGYKGKILGDKIKELESEKFKKLL